MGIFFLLGTYSKNPMFIVIGIPILIIAAFIFEKNPYIKRRKDGK